MTDGQKVDKLLSEIIIAHNIISSEMLCCVNLEQYESLLNQLSKNLNVSTQVTAKIIKNFNMVTFYKSLNINAKIDIGFLSIITEKIKQIIAKV